MTEDVLERVELGNHEQLQDDLTGTLPSTWASLRIGDVAVKLKAGGTPKRGVIGYWGGALPFVKIEDITSCDGFIWTAEEAITEAGLRASSAWLVPPGCVLLAMYATIGAVAINCVPVTTNQAIIAIVPDTSRVDAEYLLYCLRQCGKRLAALNTQTTQKNVSKGIVESFEVPVPPLPEQHAIARIIRAVQDASQARRRELDLERERKAAMMQHLFTKGTRGEPTKQTEIGEMPESWHTVRLEGLLREPLKNGYSATESRSGEGVRTLTLSAVTYNDFSILHTKITTADQERVRDLWLRQGDLFIERANTKELVGLAALYDGPEGMAIYPDLLTRVRLDVERIIPTFALEFLLSDPCRNYFRTNARGTAGNMPKIDHGTIRGTWMPLPPLGEQAEIGGVARCCDRTVAALKREIVLLEEFFRTLLEELMSGRLSALPLVETVGA